MKTKISVFFVLFVLAIGIMVFTNKPMLSLAIGALAMCLAGWVCHDFEKKLEHSYKNAKVLHCNEKILRNVYLN